MGEEGEVHQLEMEMKTIADVGLVRGVGIIWRRSQQACHPCRTCSLPVLSPPLIRLASQTLASPPSCGPFHELDQRWLHILSPHSNLMWVWWSMIVGHR